MILYIDTAQEIASTFIAKNSIIIAMEHCYEQKKHASFLHQAIKKLLDQTAISIGEIEAIAVTNGPGSYTGLRVGLAAAKGLCYAWNKPLITISSLLILAKSIQENIPKEVVEYILNPSIDARRLEVYTSLYNEELQNLIPETNLIIDDNYLEVKVLKKPVFIAGSGAKKTVEYLNNTAIYLVEQLDEANSFVSIAEQYFIQKQFADIAYATPNYGKEFYSTQKK
jgi:tRNA threonylcarbamoyladenosine biosynthesis protein TsaB